MVIYRVVFESSRRGQSEDKTLAALAKREHTLSKRLSGRVPSAAEKKAAEKLKALRSVQLEHSNEIN